MFTEIIHGEQVFEQLAGEWDSLAQRGITDTPFQTLAYQRAWWTHLHPQEGALHTVVARDRAGDLAAIGCFYLSGDGVVHFNGCIEETDYLDIIAAPENAEAAWSAIFACLLSDDFPSWRMLDLCNVPEASPSRALLANLAGHYELPFEESVHEVCPVIMLPDSFDAYLDGLDSKQRRETQRKLRRASAADAELHIVGPEDDLAAEVDAFLELLQLSTFEKRDWLNQERRAMFHEAAAAARDAGSLQLMFREVNGRKAACIFNFDYRDRVWVYNSGLDPQAFGALSLGVVLTAKAIEHAIETGNKSFDFLRGNETYKYRFGAEDTFVYRLQVARSV